MKVTPLAIPGVLKIEPRIFGDDRGFFFESYNEGRYRDSGVLGPFVQDNFSRSTHGILRGLHLQNPHGQGKLVSVLEGEVFDVAVDVRVGSPTFGKWVGERLSAQNKLQMWIPVGFAHGFCVTSEHALFHYKCTDRYAPDGEVSVLWNDPGLGIDWPIVSPVLSEKDQQALPLADVPTARLPTYTPAEE